MGFTPRTFISIRIVISSITVLRLKVCIWMLQAAVMSLGLIGVGTNNARIAGMLRNLPLFLYRSFQARSVKVFVLHLYLPPW